MKKLICIFVLLLLNSSHIFSQSGWIWQYPYPQGNWYQSIDATDSVTFYAVGKSSIILKSTNSGLTYNITQIPVGILTRTLNCVRFYDNNTGWVCGDSGTIIKTTNGGLNWNIQNSNTFINLLKIFPVSSSNIYAFGNRGIVKTIDGGNNWNVVLSGGSNQTYKDIYFANSNTGYICGYATGNPQFGLLLKTTNGGMNWNPASDFLSYSLNSFSFINENTGFICGVKRTVNPNTQSPILYKTTNSGNNWTQLYTTKYINSIKFYNEDTAIINTDNGLFITTNGSYLWDSLYSMSGVTCDWGFSDIKYLNTKKFFGVTCDRVLLSLNGGKEFKQVTQGTGSNSFYHIYFPSLAKGWCITGNKVIKTSNGGNNWIIDSVFNGNLPWSFYFINENYGWSSYPDVKKTTNGGLTWTVENSMLPWKNIQFVNSTTGYYSALNTLRFFKSTNAGNNWSEIELQPGIDLAQMQFVSTSTAFCLTTDSGGIGKRFTKTTNGGYNWFQTGYYSTGGYSSSIFFINENTGWIARKVDYNTNYSIYKTTNSGVTLIDQNLESYNFYDLWGIHFFNPDTGYVIARNSTPLILTTTNGGTNWNTSVTGLGDPIWDASFVNSKTGWICGLGGIQKTINFGNPVIIHQTEYNIPENYLLLQNYPNPFNSTSRLKFQIANSGKVKLIIYDILGREVQTLVNESLKPGTYEASFDGSMLNSGVYFYKLMTDRFTETKKMLLIK